jgi:hypothetical protein
MTPKTLKEMKDKQKKLEKIKVKCCCGTPKCWATFEDGGDGDIWITLKSFRMKKPHEVIIWGKLKKFLAHLNQEGGGEEGMKKFKFNKRKFKILLNNGDINFLLDKAFEKREMECRLKELEIIYPSLVGIAEGQTEITINVPNGRWTFKKD